MLRQEALPGASRPALRFKAKPEPHPSWQLRLEAAWADASTGLLDLHRLSEMLSRISGRLVHKRLDRISPLAVPIMLEVGRERVAGEADEDILRAAADDIIREAMA